MAEFLYLYGYTADPKSGKFAAGERAQILVALLEGGFETLWTGMRHRNRLKDTGRLVASF